MFRHTSAGWLIAISLQLGGCVDSDRPDHPVGDGPFSTGPVPAIESTSPPSFEAFEVATYREPWPGGVYVVNGDTPVADAAALRDVWSDIYGAGALIVHQANGADARWNDTQKRALTYCVSDGFGAHKAEVVAAMQAATDGGWERFADVDLIHVAAEDARCSANNDAVLFDVSPISGQPYLARAFFPNAGRDGRNIMIDDQAFGAVWTLSNVLAHEVGHVLGFRHEHTRPEAGACYEDAAWRPLTEYDSASVMHYPQCNGSANDLSFTELDARGAAILYGLPGAQPKPEPEPEPPHTDDWTYEAEILDTIATGEWKDVAVLTVAPGTVFEAVLSGSGDADLYARFGDRPDVERYDCRPYLDDTSAESCRLVVPAGVTKVYVGLDCFAYASYRLVLHWTEYAEDGGGDDDGGDGGGAAELVINEILADANELDANGDWVVDPRDDEFVEIVNIGDASADLSGGTIADAFGVRVVLPSDTVLAPGEVLLVFGGGAPMDFGPGVHVVVGQLYLNNDRDTVILRDRFGVELTSASYGNEANHDVSLVRATELDPTAALVRHTDLSSWWASPGLRADGTPFN